MDNNPDGTAISPKKLEANRRNAKLSTGPKTVEGKNQSRRNSRKHGILASAYLITAGEENRSDFMQLLIDLQTDLAPVGTLEDMLVEKIAICYWRQKRALHCEADLINKGTNFIIYNGGNLSQSIARYETAIHRQLTYAINQLERLQRTRKGELVPAPVSVQVSSDVSVLHGPNGSQTQQ